LATRISSLDDLRNLLDDQLGSRGITAVGVLGSDVYDKLEILHALQSRLRAKVFFTTGLDARFYHPDELNATRNLVVVSAFGLQLHPFYQGSVPPFRDHNQTAAFAAALCALDVMRPDRLANSKPRIYEISTNGPIDLSVDAKSDLDELKKLKKEPTNIHPGRPDLRKWWKKNNKKDWNWPLILCRLGAFVVLIGTVIFATRCIWGKQNKGGTPTASYPTSEQEQYQATLVEKSTVLAIALSLPLILIFLAVLYYHQRLKGEPCNLFASASMWPTEGIRLLVIVLSIHFVVKSFALLKENYKNEIEPAFLEPRAAPYPWWRKLRHRLTVSGAARIFLRRKWRTLLKTFTVWEHEPRPKVGELWKEYSLRDSPSSRLAWTAFLSLSYGLAALCLWLVSVHAIAPVRGHQMLSLDKWLNIAAMGASTFLTLFVAYATGLDARFAVLLNNGETDWPEEIRKRHRLNSAKGAGWTDFNSDYLDVLLIAKRTRAVTHLIYYPFITTSLLILCRLPQFDNFDWPPLLIAAFSFNIFVPCACVAVLRRVAEMVRRGSLSRLKQKLRKERARALDTRREAIETTMQKIKNLDTGIFAPITRQPVVGALLLPFGSAGVSALLQYVH